MKKLIMFFAILIATGAYAQTGPGWSLINKKTTFRDSTFVTKGIKYPDGTIGTTGFLTGDTVQLNTLVPILEDSTDSYATPTQVRSLITSLASLDSIVTGTSDTACDGNIYLNTVSNQIRYREGFYWYGLSKSDSTILLGSELLTNGGFGTTDWWYLGDNANQSITGGKLVLNDPSGWCSYYARTPVELAISRGHAYRLVFTVSGYTSGQLIAHFGGSPVGFDVNSTYITANGTYTYDFILDYAISPGANNFMRFMEPCGGQCVLSIDDVSLKEIFY